jgi:hypothetical protein
MHARAGVNPDQMTPALVVHGPAATDLLANPAYKVRFGVENPNAALLAALQSGGYQLISFWGFVAGPSGPQVRVTGRQRVGGTVSRHSPNRNVSAPGNRVAHAVSVCSAPGSTTTRKFESS